MSSFPRPAIGQALVRQHQSRLAAAALAARRRPLPVRHRPPPRARRRLVLAAR